MKIGVYTDARNPPRWRRSWSDYYGTLLETAEEAERLGIDELWFSEHHGFEDGYLPQPMTLAAAVAGRTKRLGLATAIMLGPLRPAIDIAEQAALVDVISNGRVQIGLGAGYRPAEFRAYGADFDQRFQLLEARFKEIRQIWAEGEILPPPVQKRLPLWVGGLGPRAARMAARLGEGYLWLQPDCVAAYLGAWEKEGRDPADARVSGLANMIISADPERAWAEIAPHLSYMFGSYARYAGGEEPDRGTAATSLTAVGEEPDAEGMRDGGPVMLPPAFDVVEPAEAVRRIEVWLDGMPVESLYFWLSIAGMPDSLVNRHMELLATEVRPKLTGIGIPVATT